ncbi:MAG: hypothetical protein MK081_12005 [Flavobacteriales bacterium]|nr:hypothetical protein [Flavobacteriales bacterium]
MNPILRNVLAIIAGIVAGSFLNMGLIQVIGIMIPAPEGVDVNDMRTIIDNADKFEGKHFVGPFLGHAIGTLMGTWVAVRLSARKRISIALALGIWFLLGGITAAALIPSPTWFIVLDLALAYIPMAWFAWMISKKDPPETDAPAEVLDA